MKTSVTLIGSQLKSFRFKRITFLFFSFLLATTQIKAQTYWYYAGTGALNNTASWGTNPNGTGTAPSDFITDNQIFVIQNTVAITHNSGIFSVAGVGSKIVMGNPTYASPGTASPAITITIAAGAQITNSGNVNFEVSIPSSGNHRIVYQNTSAISFGLVNDANLELVFDGNTLTTTTSRTFGNVSLINNANVTMAGASIVVNNLLVEAGSTLSGPIGASSNYIGVKAGGVVTINGTFRAGRTGGLATISGAPFPTTTTSSGSLLYQDATITQGTNLILGANSTIDFNRGTTSQASTAQTINALNYVNLTLSNSGVANSKQFAVGNINVSGTMTINLLATATVITPGATTNVNIQPTGTFVISSASTFGTVAGNQRITFKSDATGTASIGTMAAGSGFFGSINVEKFIPGGFRKYRFLSHPFSASQPLSELTGEIDITGNPAGTTGLSGQTTGTGFTTTSTNNPSAYYFNTATANGASPNDAGWTAFIDNTTTTNWQRGKGIRVLVRGTKAQTGTLDGTDATPNAVTLTLNGNTNVGAVAVPMVNTATGLNLMGNPYVSPVDIGQVLTAAGSTNVGNAFYLRNPQTESFITISPIPTSYIIPAFSAFFVQALTNPPNNLNFAESNKSTCVSCPTVFRTTSTGNRLELKAYKNGLEYDNVIFNIDPTYDNNYDKRTDAPKLMNNGFNLYSISDDQIKLAANSIKNSKKSILPLGVSLPKRSSIQTYQLKVADYSFGNGTKVLLHDKLTNQYILLQKDKEYNLTIDPNNDNSIGDKRLELIIEN
jgi:trimeric autotransporter adhesin